MMDETSLRNAVSISPRTKFSLTFSTDTGSFSAMYLMYIGGENGKDDPIYANPGGTLTVTIDGIAKSAHNQFLDGNKDGTGGDDFVEAYTFPTDYNPGCSCESYSSCSCQSYSCTCVGFDCSCMYAACPGNIY
jgi:hypothetical protein